MNFQEIKHIEPYQFYLDLAFRRSREKGVELRGSKLKGDRVEKSRYIEILKMQVVSDTIIARMQSIIRNFPSLAQLPPFYLELVKLHIDYPQLKQSLGAIQWVGTNTRSLFNDYKQRLKRNTQYAQIAQFKSAYLGRVSSLLKQVKSDFVFLEAARKIMKGFPEIKTGLRTVAIVGFPNVGKTTLLSKITGSTADIANYAFTTRGINVGYLGKGKERIQLLDTPGTLDRFEKMNYIEKTATLAIRHCAQLLVYVFDPTDTYPLDKQEKLYERLCKDYSLPLLIYVSKTDVSGIGETERITKKYDCITDPQALYDAIIKHLPALPEPKPQEEPSE